jgi:hypothetical protein
MIVGARHAVPLQSCMESYFSGSPLVMMVVVVVMMMMVVRSLY